jgi:hypothetical protein
VHDQLEDQPGQPNGGGQQDIKPWALLRRHRSSVGSPHTGALDQVDVDGFIDLQESLIPESCTVAG